MTQFAIKPIEDVHPMESRNRKNRDYRMDMCSSPEVSDLSSWTDSEHAECTEVSQMVRH